jgi:hypothetical protein
VRRNRDGHRLSFCGVFSWTSPADPLLIQIAHIHRTKRRTASFPRSVNELIEVMDGHAKYGSRPRPAFGTPLGPGALARKLRA